MEGASLSSSEPTLEIISCPQCGVPAEVVGDFTLGSTHGAVEHLVTLCVAGHWTPRVETVPGYAPAAVPGEAADPIR